MRLGKVEVPTALFLNEFHTGASSLKSRGLLGDGVGCALSRLKCPAFAGNTGGTADLFVPVI